MKKQLFTLIFAIMTAVSAHAQESQSIRAEIPFAFTVSDRTLPAGTYQLDSASQNRNVWKLQSTTEKARIFVLANILTGSPDPGRAQLTFRRYGNRNYLAGFATWSYQISLSPSDAEQALRRPGMKLANYEVITVDSSMTPKTY